MAKIFIYLLLPLLIVFLQIFPTAIAYPTFLKSTKRNPTKLRAEKLTHFRTYWHDTTSGSHPTSVTVVPAINKCAGAVGFGMVRIIDDALTETHDLDSKLLGRAQGLYTIASQGESALLIALNFVSTTGKYNGSTVTIMGWNPVFREVREMPVVGGSGLFRFARGYVQARTYSFDVKTGDAVVAYDVHVLHY